MRWLPVLMLAVCPLNGQEVTPPDLKHVVMRGCDLRKALKEDGQLNAKTGLVENEHYVWEVFPYVYYSGKKARWNWPGYHPLWESTPFLKDSVDEMENLYKATNACMDWSRQVDKLILEAKNESRGNKGKTGHR